MTCPSCGHENPEDAKFCGECGAALTGEVECPSCGRSNQPGQRFCHGCGAPVSPLGRTSYGVQYGTPRARDSGAEGGVTLPGDLERPTGDL